ERQAVDRDDRERRVGRELDGVTHRPIAPSAQTQLVALAVESGAEPVEQVHEVGCAGRGGAEAALLLRIGAEVVDRDRPVTDVADELSRRGADRLTLRRAWRSVRDER